MILVPSDLDVNTGGAYPAGAKFKAEAAPVYKLMSPATFKDPDVDVNELLEVPRLVAVFV